MPNATGSNNAAIQLNDKHIHAPGSRPSDHQSATIISPTATRPQLPNLGCAELAHPSEQDAVPRPSRLAASSTNGIAQTRKNPFKRSRKGKHTAAAAAAVYATRSSRSESEDISIVYDDRGDTPPKFYGDSSDEELEV